MLLSYGLHLPAAGSRTGNAWSSGSRTSPPFGWKKEESVGAQPTQPKGIFRDGQPSLNPALYMAVMERSTLTSGVWTETLRPQGCTIG